MVAGIVAQRQLNVLALLMLAVNVAGIGVSFATGDPRLMIAKDSAVSSVIGLAATWARWPAGDGPDDGRAKPWLTRGAAERDAAWSRLLAGSARFRRLEPLFSVIWGDRPAGRVRSPDHRRLHRPGADHGLARYRDPFRALGVACRRPAWRPAR